MPHLRWAADGRGPRPCGGRLDVPTSISFMGCTTASTWSRWGRARPRPFCSEAGPRSPDVALIRRRRGSKVAGRNLADGPGKLCQALAVTRNRERSRFRRSAERPHHTIGWPHTARESDREPPADWCRLRGRGRVVASSVEAQVSSSRVEISLSTSMGFSI